MKKSNIPWENHCMRKFGGNIKQEIFDMAVKQNANIIMYRKLKEVDDLAKRIQKKEIFISPTEGEC